MAAIGRQVQALEVELADLLEQQPPENSDLAQNDELMSFFRTQIEEKRAQLQELQQSISSQPVIQLPLIADRLREPHHYNTQSQLDGSAASSLEIPCDFPLLPISILSPIYSEQQLREMDERLESAAKAQTYNSNLSVTYPPGRLREEEEEEDEEDDEKMFPSIEALPQLTRRLTAVADLSRSDTVVPQAITSISSPIEPHRRNKPPVTRHYRLRMTVIRPATPPNIRALSAYIANGGAGRY